MSTYQTEDEWTVLSDRTRRAIVERLAERPRAVGELAQELPVSRPAVSQHLKVLKDAGLVVERAAGTRRIYRLDPVAVGALRDQLDTFWARALAGYTEVTGQRVAGHRVAGHTGVAEEGREKRKKENKRKRP